MENLRSKGQSVPEGATSEALFGVGTVLYADNVVQLKANIGSATRPIAVLAGYNAIGDGGGGVSYWNTSAALVDDGGTILPTVPAAARGFVFSPALSMSDKARTPTQITELEPSQAPRSGRPSITRLSGPA